MEHPAIVQVEVVDSFPLDSFPLNASGKVFTSELRERAR
jgi:hypothetical protein